MYDPEAIRRYLFAEEYRPCGLSDVASFVEAFVAVDGEDDGVIDTYRTRPECVIVCQ